MAYDFSKLQVQDNTQQIQQLETLVAGGTIQVEILGIPTDVNLQKAWDNQIKESAIAEFTTRGASQESAEATVNKIASDLGSLEQTGSFLLEVMKSDDLAHLNRFASSDEAYTSLSENLVQLYKDGELDDFTKSINENPEYKTQLAYSLQAGGDISALVSQYQNPPSAPEPITYDSPAINWAEIAIADNSGVTEQLGKLLEDGEISWGESKGLTTWGEGLNTIIENRFDNKFEGINASEYREQFINGFDGDATKAANFLNNTLDVPELEQLYASTGTPMAHMSLTNTLSTLAESGQLDDFVQKLQDNPAYKDHIANQLMGVDYKKAPEIIMRFDEQPVQPTVPELELKDPEPIATIPQSTSTEDLLTEEQKKQVQAIKDLLEEHVKNNPEDIALKDEFLSGVLEDKKLQDALGKFYKNNQALFDAENSDADTMGFDKDRLIHDLLEGYKKDKEATYATLTDENFQMNAFMQYSSIGQMLGFLIEPILDWLGDLLGVEGDIGGFANLNIEQWFGDFQDLLGDGTNNLLAMGNDLDFGQRMGGMFNVVMGAAKDATNMTDMDRYYRDNPPQATITRIDEHNNQVSQDTYGSGLDAPDPNAPDQAAIQQQRELEQQQRLQQQQNQDLAGSPSPATPASGSFA